jgi:hypothetical protein
MNANRSFIALVGIFSFLSGGRGEQPTGSFTISDKELLARGWSETEFRQIVGDFQKMYRDRLPQDFSAEVHTVGGGILRATFPADIEPRLFCWLINYLQYPKGFDLKSRAILVAGRATIGSDFLPSEQSLIGKHIMFYIPTDDKDYDVVFAQVDGQSYKYPFCSERRQRAQESRMPGGASDLK